MTGLHPRHDLTKGVVSVWRTARTRAQFGLRGVRVGEASHPCPASKGSRAQRLRALQRSRDSDGESTSNEMLRGSALSPEHSVFHETSLKRWSKISARHIRAARHSR